MQSTTKDIRDVTPHKDAAHKLMLLLDYFLTKGIGQN